MSHKQPWSGRRGGGRVATLSQTSVVTSTWYTVANITSASGYLGIIAGCNFETATTSGITKSSGDELNFRITIDGGSAITLTALDCGEYSIDDYQLGYDPSNLQTYAVRRVNCGSMRFNVSALVEVQRSAGTKDYIYAYVSYSTDS